MNKPTLLLYLAALLLCSCPQTNSFSTRSGIFTTTSPACRPGGKKALFMGRAAAVRAATKSKTDAKKAKTNAVFGKKIIMAVKTGGSPSPDSNRALADVIKQAKASNVPVDVRT